MGRSFAEVFSDTIRFESEVFPRYNAILRHLRGGESPQVLFITCCDSRIDPHLLTGSQPGDLFVVRNVGNMVPVFGNGTVSSEAAAIEYAVETLQVGHVVICGHTDCGAMRAIVDGVSRAEPESSVAAWLRAGSSIRGSHRSMYPSIEQVDLLRLAAQENIVAQLERLLSYPFVRRRLRPGLELHGWLFDISAGSISSYRRETQRFVNIALDD